MEVGIKMAKYMELSLNKNRAENETQIFDNKSFLEHSKEVKEIEMKINQDKENESLWMEKGMALSKQMLFREAIEAFSMGLSYNPFDPLLYRHRGHRFISIRRFNDASADLELSSRLDNKNWNTWYHLGLAYYLLGDYQRASKAYEVCLELTKQEELLVAIVDWYWMTLMRLTKNQEAEEILKLVSKDTNCGENLSYKKRVLLYKQEITSEELIKQEGAEYPDLEFVTQGYGLANYYYLNGKLKEAKEIYSKILKHDKIWSAFGYIAAMVDVENKILERK